MSEVKRFGEKQVNDIYSAFIEYGDGRLNNNVTEDEIEALWWQWIVASGVYRADSNGYNIFAYKTPTEIKPNPQAPKKQ